MKRISIVGPAGAGKTTLARELARRLNAAHINAAHIELDALHWEPGWKEAPDEVFRHRVAEAVAAPAWTCDGNYHMVRDIVWRRAEAVVWLDYPLPLVLARLMRRTFRRAVLHEACCNGNREGWHQVLGRDSILRWFFKSYWRHKRRYPELFAQTEFAHLHIVRLRSPHEAQTWLRRVFGG